MRCRCDCDPGRRGKREPLRSPSHCGKTAATLPTANRVIVAFRSAKAAIISRYFRGAKGDGAKNRILRESFPANRRSRIVLQDDSGMMIIGVVIGQWIAIGLHALPRYCETRVSPFQPMPWHYYGIFTILLTVFAVSSQGWGQWLWIAAAAILLLVTVWKFCKQRVQFSVRSMLLVTLLVAMMCSARYYVPLTAVLALLAMPAGEWIRLEEARRLALPPPQGPGDEADPR